MLEDVRRARGGVRDGGDVTGTRVTLAGWARCDRAPRSQETCEDIDVGLCWYVLEVWILFSSQRILVLLSLTLTAGQIEVHGVSSSL